MPTQETDKGKAVPTVVVRIPVALWERCGKLAERLGKQGAEFGVGNPSKASVLRAALDRGLNALGRSIGEKERSE